MKPKHLVQLLLGLAISAAALYFFVFRNVSVRELLACFRGFRYIWLLPALAMFYFGIWLRGVRWKWLFLPRHKVSLKNATGGMFICFAFNSVFPGRVGEFARAYLIGKQEKTGFSTALGTVVCERLIDALTILAMWVVAFLIAGKTLVGQNSSMTIQMFGMEPITLTGRDFLAGARGVVVLAAALFVFIICVRVPRTRGWILRVLHAFTFVPAPLRNKAEQLVHRFAEGLESLSSPGRFILLFLFSFLLWVTNSISVLWLSYGFNFAHTMTLAQSLVLIVIAAIFIMIPAAPGYWGLFEAGVIFAVVIMGIHPDDAMVRSYAILLHLTQWLPIVAIGLPWAWVSHVSLGDVEKAEDSAESLEEAR
jgi:glycosyltransferase 2 family protein